MSDANVAVLLAEDKAHWIDSLHLGLLPDENIVREWRNLNVQTRTDCIAHLKSRTTVTNPKAQTKEYTGVWRVLKIEDIVERNRQGGVDSLTIRETLADGYDATLVGKFPRLAEEADVIGSGTTEAANIAHPGGTAAVQEDWRTVTIRWKDLNHDSLEAIRVERSAVTATTLTVGTEAKTGPWYLISRKPSWEEDGTGVYEETWSLDEWHMESKGKTGNTKVVVNRYVQNVPKDRVKTVLDAEIAACTGYGTQGYTYDQKIYWRELYADIITEVSQAVKIEIVAFTAELDDSKTVSEKSGENLYDADIAAYETTTAAQGHTIRTQKSRNSDGTLNASKTDALAIKQEIAIEDSLVSAGKTEQTKKGNNLFDADLSGYAIAQTTGKIIRREKVINQDGTYDVVITESAASNLTASTDGTHSDQHLDADNRTEDTETHTAASAPLADVAFATQGTIVETENSPNDDGTFRTTAKTVVSKEQEILDVVVGEDKFKQSKADYGKQIKDTNLAAHFPVAATTGEIQTRRISENPDGTVDVQRDRDIAKTVASVETSSEISLFETVTTDVDRNNTAGDTPPVSQTAGTIVKVTNKKNEYDRVDVAVETRTATGITDADKSKTISLFETDTEVTDRHQTAAVTPETTQTAGQVVTTRSQKDEFGRFTNTTATKDSTNITEARKETKATAFETVSAITDKNDAAAETASTSQTPGTIKTVTAVKNEFGEYDNTLETRTSLPASTTYSSQSAALTTEETVSARNAAAKADAAGGGSGTIVQVTSRLNEFGKYDNDTATKTAVEKADAGKTTNVASDSVVTTDVARNISEPADLSATPTAGTINIQAKRLNEFGKWDVETTADARQDQSIATGNVVKTPRYTSAVEIVDGKSTAPTALGVNEYGRVSYRKDKYGRYVGEKEVTAYTDTFDIPGWALSSTHYHVTHIIRTTYKGVGYKRTIGYVIYELQTGSAATAIAHCDTGLVGTEAGSSSYHPLANGQYKATRIEADADATGTWEVDSGGTFP